MKRKYIVKFYVLDELKTDVVIFAPNEATAILLALAAIGMPLWITEAGYSIKIEQARDNAPHFLPVFEPFPRKSATATEAYLKTETKSTTASAVLQPA